MRLASMLSVTLAAKLLKSAVEIELELLGILRISYMFTVMKFHGQFSPSEWDFDTISRTNFRTLNVYRISNFARHVLRIPSFEFSIILTVAFVLIGIFVFKYDWGAILNSDMRNQRE